MFASLRRSFFSVGRLFSLGRGNTNLQFGFREQREHHNNCNAMATKSALVILAPGMDEVEFTIIATILRRADVNVTVAGLDGTDAVKCSLGIVIMPETSLQLAAVIDYDAVVLAGGFDGSMAMGESDLVGELLRAQEAKGALICATSTAPTVLAKQNIATGKSLTSHPAMKAALEPKYCYVDDKNVVQDGNLISSRGPGTVYEFAQKIVEQLSGTEKAQAVPHQCLCAANNL